MVPITPKDAPDQRFEVYNACIADPPRHLAHLRRLPTCGQKAGNLRESVDDAGRIVRCVLRRRSRLTRRTRKEVKPALQIGRRSTRRDRLSKEGGEIRYSFGFRTCYIEGLPKLGNLGFVPYGRGLPVEQLFAGHRIKNGSGTCAALDVIDLVGNG